ncbi:MAG: hypothetical protein Q4F57_10210 [Weeksellaceae bacterium]|nr:hypothetical protein [Weeksellaceae bacterium]
MAEPTRRPQTRHRIGIDMKINLQGNIVSSQSVRVNPINSLWLNNGILTESLRVYKQKILFLEDHYFKLMSKLRISRTPIPIELTPDYFYRQLQQTLEANELENAILHFHAGLLQNKLEFIITVQNDVAPIQSDYHLGNYTDFYIEENPLEFLGFGQGYARMFQVFADENQWDDLLIFRKVKSVLRTKNGCLFILHKGTLRSSIPQEPWRSVWQSNFLEFLSSVTETPIEPDSTIFPYEVSQAEGVFVWQDFIGMQPVTQYKNKAVPMHSDFSVWQNEWNNYLDLVAEKDPLQHI